VQTISIVPVGATEQFEERMERAHRPLDETRACSPAYARALIQQVRGWQRRLRAEHGASIVHPADEYYLAAGARIPGAAVYDDFPQYENGIGMTRALLDDWHETRRRLRRSQPLPSSPLQLTIACGTLIAPLLARLCAEFDALLGTETRVVSVANRRLGPRINVSGLLSAGDFVAALRDEDLGDLVVLPRPALDYFGRRFLDDQTPADVERVLNRPIRFASSLSDVAELVFARRAGGDALLAGRGESSNGAFWASRETAG